MLKKRKDLDEILERRQELINRLEQHRDTIARGAHGLERPIGLAVWGFRAARFVRRNPVLVGLSTAVISKVLVGRVARLFGYKPKKKKATWFGQFGTWASRIGTAATIARQLILQFRQQRKHPEPPPATE